MKRLPHWVLTDTFPAFYDSESLTATEQTARVYAAIQQLIDEYNKFVDEMNEHINEYETALEKDLCCFKKKIIHTTESYIQSIDTKMKLQDMAINKAIEKMNLAYQTFETSMTTTIADLTARIETLESAGV